MKRIYEMDNLRGLSIIGVILIHITASINIDNVGIMSEMSTMFLNQISRFVVPAFLFLSGWGLTYTNIFRNGFRSFFLMKLPEILIPYFIWNIAYYSLLILVSNQNINLIDFLKRVLIGECQ